MATVKEIFQQFLDFKNQPFGKPPKVSGAQILSDMLKPSQQGQASGLAEAYFDEWTASITKFVIAAGDGQFALPGQAVRNPLSVKVMDGDGTTPIVGVLVRFGVTAGDGVLSDVSVPTDGSGIANVASWTLGSAGINSVTAVCGGQSVKFTATARGTLAANSPTDQAGSAGGAVGRTPEVKVTDSTGTAIQGVPIKFTVTAGGGTVKAPDKLTDASGLANCEQWVLGTPGANELVASAGLQSIVFKATAS